MDRFRADDASIVPTSLPQRAGYLKQTCGLISGSYTDAIPGSIFMNSQEILLRFEKEAAALGHCDPFSLASLFAQCMSELSEKLSNDEFEQLILIGAGIYHCGTREYGKDVPVDDLLPACESVSRKIKSSLYE